MPCCTALCCAALCCAALCFPVLCCSMLVCTALFYAALFCAALCCAALCCAALCCAVLLCAVLRCAVLLCSVLRCAHRTADMQRCMKAEISDSTLTSLLSEKTHDLSNGPLEVMWYRWNEKHALVLLAVTKQINESNQANLEIKFLLRD